MTYSYWHRSWNRLALSFLLLPVVSFTSPPNQVSMATDLQTALGTFMAPKEAKPPVSSYSSVTLSLGDDQVSTPPLTQHHAR